MIEWRRQDNELWFGIDRKSKLVAEYAVDGLGNVTRLRDESDPGFAYSKWRLCGATEKEAVLADFHRWYHLSGTAKADDTIMEIHKGLELGAQAIQ